MVVSTPWTAAASAGRSSPPPEELDEGDGAAEDGAADVGAAELDAAEVGAAEGCATGRKDTGRHPATRITKAANGTILDHIRQILPHAATVASGDSSESRPRRPVTARGPAP
ncbi:hypothetical protein GCM10010404_57760 [Nonomuraea africana]